jgi:hypothetical protein
MVTARSTATQGRWSPAHMPIGSNPAAAAPHDTAATVTQDRRGRLVRVSGSRHTWTSQADIHPVVPVRCAPARRSDVIRDQGGSAALGALVGGAPADGEDGGSGDEIGALELARRAAATDAWCGLSTSGYAPMGAALDVNGDNRYLLDNR